MKLFTTILLFVLLFFGSSVQAQFLSDAVRYSMLEPAGTARTVGIGGAIGALGADFTSLSINPAGLGAYRRSEFTFTPAMEFSNTEMQLQGEGNLPFDQTKNRFNFSNVGLVYVSTPLRTSWRTTAFGIGLNRMAGFYQSAYFSGSSQGSITDRFLDLAQGVAPSELDDFEGGVAYDAEAIYNPDPDDNTLYASDFLEGEVVDKSQRIERKGAFNEIVISLGGNYEDRLMVGATLGIPIFTYEETKTYLETDEANANPVFNELTFTERLRTTGSGINLKAGLIYRVNQMVRLGAAIHTPTALRNEDSFSNSLNYNYSLDGTAYTGNGESLEGSLEYRLRTPWRIIGSAAFIFGKNGFLSADVEYVDYTNANFKLKNVTQESDRLYEAELNRDIAAQFTSALNVRLGGEFAYEIFRLRGGYTLTGTPYSEGFDPVGAFSLGAGIRGESVFLDVAYRQQSTQNDYQPYLTSSGVQPLVETDSRRSKVLVTIGFKF